MVWPYTYGTLVTLWFCRCGTCWAFCFCSVALYMYSFSYRRYNRMTLKLVYCMHLLKVFEEKHMCVGEMWVEKWKNVLVSKLSIVCLFVDIRWQRNVFIILSLWSLMLFYFMHLVVWRGKLHEAKKKIFHNEKYCDIRHLSLINWVTWSAKDATRVIDTRRKWGQGVGRAHELWWHHQWSVKGRVAENQAGSKRSGVGPIRDRWVVGFLFL